MGREGARALPEIMKLLKENEYYVRAAAVEAIASMSLDGIEVCPLLIQFLRDDNKYVRKDAIRAFELIGKEGAEALPELIRLLSDREYDVRNAAIIAIGSIVSVLNLSEFKIYSKHIFSFNNIRRLLRLDEDTLHLIVDKQVLLSFYQWEYEDIFIMKVMPSWIDFAWISILVVIGSLLVLFIGLLGKELEDNLQVFTSLQRFLLWIAILIILALGLLGFWVQRELNKKVK